MFCISDILGDQSVFLNHAAFNFTVYVLCFRYSGVCFMVVLSYLSLCMYYVSDILGNWGMLRGASAHLSASMFYVSDILGDLNMLYGVSTHLSPCMFYVSDILGNWGMLRGASAHLLHCIFCISDIPGDCSMLFNRAVTYLTLYVLCVMYSRPSGHAWWCSHILHPVCSMFQIFWAISACFVVLLPIFDPVCPMFQIFWAIGACFVVVLSLFVMPILGWRYLLALSAMPLLIFTLACTVSE